MVVSLPEMAKAPDSLIYIFYHEFPKRQQKKSHDRRLVALATYHVFKLFYLKYDLFNFHYGYQQSMMYMLYQKLTEVSTYL